MHIWPLSNATLDAMDMTAIQADAHGGGGYIMGKSGMEHYRLLAHIAQMNHGKKFLDLGTHLGWSALALASNVANQVVTYDLTDHFVKQACHNKPNITYKIMNFLHDTAELAGTDLILLDVDPHDGIQEKQYIDKLIELNYRGVVLMDDVFTPVGFPGLHAYFESIPLRKENLTPYGHVSGTGLVYFD